MDAWHDARSWVHDESMSVLYWRSTRPLPWGWYVLVTFAAFSDHSLTWTDLATSWPILVCCIVNWFQNQLALMTNKKYDIFLPLYIVFSHKTKEWSLFMDCWLNEVQSNSWKGGSYLSTSWWTLHSKDENRFVVKKTQKSHSRHLLRSVTTAVITRENYRETVIRDAR